MTEPLKVVIAGAGVAGLETVAALHSLAGPRVQLILVEPGDEFVYRPQSVGEPFGMKPAQRHRIAAIASDFGAELVPRRLESVLPQLQKVMLAGDGDLDYDALVLALGARPEPAWEH